MKRLNAAAIAVIARKAGPRTVDTKRRPWLYPVAAVVLGLMVAGVVAALRVKSTDCSLRDEPAIIFQRQESIGGGTYRMRPDGACQSAAITVYGNGRVLGNRVVFVQDGPREKNEVDDDEIFVATLGGADRLQLTNSLGSNGRPAWSPDGSRIAFASTRDGNNEIYVIDSDGGRERRLTFNPAPDRHPSWSPDGSRIAFTSTRDGDEEIYTVSAEGGGEQRLTTNKAADTTPAWSPIGNKIAFVSTRDGNEEIYLISAEGGAEQRLTMNPGVDNDPDWSPEGSQIAFVSIRGDGHEIFTMNGDGTGQRNISRFGGYDVSPQWVPSGLLFPSRPTPEAEPD